MEYNKTVSGLFYMSVAKFIENVMEKATREEFPFIITNGGVKYRIGWPHLADLSIYDIAHALSRYCRFTGHIDAPLYSVAQHSWLVSYICDPKDALWGLLHDATEAYVGDMASPLKNMPGMEAFKYYEKLTMNCICSHYGLPLEEPESVKFADKRLLMTEMRDLFTCEAAHVWAAERYHTYPPLEDKILPWSQRVAELKFLERFNELIGIQERNEATASGVRLQEPVLQRPCRERPVRADGI